VWISQDLIEKTKEALYEKTKDERVLWASPLEIVCLAKQKKCKVDFNTLLRSFSANHCTAEDVANLFNYLNSHGEGNVEREMLLKVIAEPEERKVLQEVKCLIDRYYPKRKKNPLEGIPKIKQFVTRFRNKERHYRSFAIPKRNGGRRIIEAPTQELANIQRLILKKILYRNQIWNSNSSVHGFVPGRNILSNASLHKEATVIVRIDLKDAFRNTKEEMLVKHLKEYFTEKGAKILVRLCTYKGHLPQGAPSSGMLLNFVLGELDGKLKKIAGFMGWRYSRYADDLTFSCVEFNKHTVGIGKLIERVKSMIKDYSYRVNEEKIRVFKKNRAMRVTGLVLNSGKPTISRKFRRNVRAKVHNFVTKGIGNEKEVLGYISYINLANKKYAKKLLRMMEKLPSTHVPRQDAIGISSGVASE
jgi:hypothetical protein